MSTLILDDVATDDNFHEQAYLLANPDVAEAVKRGNLRSGKDHFTLWGRKEGRRLRLSVLDAFAKAKARRLVQPSRNNTPFRPGVVSVHRSI
jgi:hypothetical protein